MSFRAKVNISALVLIVFAVWYFFIYRHRIEETRSVEFDQIPASETVHILWGVPLCENDVIFEYEGFVSGYDTLKLNPLWVSYHLKKDYFRGKKYLREREFAPDPTMDLSNTALNADYKGSGYDRGHMARLADMKGRSKNCELESCYFTNISPQKRDFNRDTWNVLEEAVDKLTSGNDESWVITGPYFDNERSFINNRVEIPDGFYKILILRSKNQYSPLAFVMDHQADSPNLELYQVSIDSVENLTDINFFPDLQDSIEQVFESKLMPIPYGWK
ncbi:MAG TPA: DNA/RNA non-specific endonuclease [Clostridiales bacterium]|nr:DNA/RNA non-specific endonuclease [Clostridiales bacterium]HQP70922.1 DNA/RNA non-specific endonuclease [Clostridiales bacterium]